MATLHRPGLPGSPAQGPTWAQPFDMLAACHERVERSLALLQRLVAYLQGAAPQTEQAAAAAADVLRYFDLAAPQHHLDEERHVLPRLRASGQAELLAAADRIESDHRRMEQVWAALRLPLQQVADGAACDLSWLRHQAQAFVDLHASHLPLEDGLALPQAQARTTQAEAVVMGREMAQRRGAPLPDG